MTLNHPTLPLEHRIVADPAGTEYQHFNVPSSLVLLPCGKLMVVFNAHRNHHKCVLGAYSADQGKSWSRPKVLFSNDVPSLINPLQEKHYSDGILVVVNDTKVLLYAVSPRINPGKNGSSETVSWRRVSEDGGLTFGAMEQTPRHRKYFVGTVNPAIKLQNGALAMGYSWDLPSENNLVPNGESEMKPCSGVLISTDEGETWEAGGDVRVDAPKATPHLPRAISGIVEPAIVELADGTLYLLGRTGTNHLWQSFSKDSGKTWEPATASSLISHNCPAALLRQKDGSVIVAYNNDPLYRARLSICISTDGCRSWSKPKLLVPTEIANGPVTSYPVLCGLKDGSILVVYAQRDDSDISNPYILRSTRFNKEYCMYLES